MKNLKKLGAAVVLTCALGLTALAGEIDTPPHASADPGQIDTPPSAAAQMATSGDMGTPTVAINEASLTEIASSVLLSIVSLF